MYIRYQIAEMCLDIEHEIKVKLVNSVTSNQSEDGYEIVRKYFNREDPNFHLLNTIKRHKSGEYCKDLIDKYYPYFLIWVLVEVVPFGGLLHVCDFYEKEYNCKIIPSSKLMNVIRDLRNASAHSNCLLNQMNKRIANRRQADEHITTFVKNMEIVGTASRRNNLRKIFTNDLVTLLYVYDQIMPDMSKKRKFSELSYLMHDKVIEHAEYFKDNSEIKSTYTFLKKIIDKLNSVDYTKNSIERQ